MLPAVWLFGIWDMTILTVLPADDIFDFRREIYKWCLSDQAIKIIGQLDL